MPSAWCILDCSGYPVFSYLYHIEVYWYSMQHAERRMQAALGTSEEGIIIVNGQWTHCATECYAMYMAGSISYTARVLNLAALACTGMSESGNV